MIKIKNELHTIGKPELIRNVIYFLTGRISEKVKILGTQNTMKVILH